jgi:hypothetical protein
MRSTMKPGRPERYTTLDGSWSAPQNAATERLTRSLRLQPSAAARAATAAAPAPERAHDDDQRHDDDDYVEPGSDDVAPHEGGAPRRRPAHAARVAYTRRGMLARGIGVRRRGGRLCNMWDPRYCIVRGARQKTSCTVVGLAFCRPAGPRRRWPSRAAAPLRWRTGRWRGTSPPRRAGSPRWSSPRTRAASPGAPRPP